ncbi:MAG: hypothetical protein ACRCTF_06165 [Bacteroidales bacterium]
MRQLFVFIAGVIVGALLIVGISSAIRSSESYKQKQMLAGMLLSRLENLTEEPKVNVQYIEVKGRKGRVMLFTTMHKDSVQSLLGKPDEVRMRTSYNGSVEEDWGYKINNKYYSDLDIEFVDGLLKGVNQR